MVVTDQGNGVGADVDASAPRSVRGSRVMSVVVAILAVASTAILASIWSPGLQFIRGPLGQAMDAVDFQYSPSAIAVIALILMVGAVLVLIPTTRGAGFGILVSAGGFLTYECSGLSQNFYPNPNNQPFQHYDLSGASELYAYGALMLSFGLAAYAAVGLVFGSPSSLAPSPRTRRARTMFVVASVSALVSVVLGDFYPIHYAWRSLAPFGILLDLLGMIGIAGPFLVLALTAGRRAPAVGVTVTWVVVTLVYWIELSSGIIYGYSRPTHWLVLIPLVVAAIFGIIGCTNREAVAPIAAVGMRSDLRRCTSGHAMPPGAMFCPACGEPPLSQPTPLVLMCANGHVVPIGGTFCTECGGMVTAPVPTDVTRSATGLVQGSYSAMTPPSPGAATNGFAIGALISGILGLSVLAIVFGFVARSQIRQSAGSQKGGGMAMAGIILGFVWIALSIAFTIAIFALASHLGSTA